MKVLLVTMKPISLIPELILIVTLVVYHTSNYLNLANDSWTKVMFIIINKKKNPASVLIPMLDKIYGGKGNSLYLLFEPSRQLITALDLSVGFILIRIARRYLLPSTIVLLDIFLGSNGLFVYCSKSNGH